MFITKCSGPQQSLSEMESLNQFYPATAPQFVLAMVKPRSTSYDFHPNFTVLADGLSRPGNKIFFVKLGKPNVFPCFFRIHKFSWQWLRTLQC